MVKAHRGVRVMKKIFIGSIILPVLSLFFILLKVCNVVDWDYQVVVAPLYFWFVILMIMLVVWLIKDGKDNE